VALDVAVSMQIAHPSLTTPDCAGSGLTIQQERQGDRRVLSRGFTPGPQMKRLVLGVRLIAMVLVSELVSEIISMNTMTLSPSYNGCQLHADNLVAHSVASRPSASMLC